LGLAASSRPYVAEKEGIGGRIRRTLKEMRKHYWLYILCAPGVLWFIVFRYVPMWGVLVAFQDFNIHLGFWESEWVGLVHFQRFFSSGAFTRLVGNTLIISFLNFPFAFPAPIFLALMLNELRCQRFKRSIQTLIYIPNFISWVIIASMTFMLLSHGGPINGILRMLGLDTVAFLTEVHTFRYIIVLQTIWRGAGWGTIIFLAALTGVDLEQYEAAIVDGAGRWKQVWHITLPALRGTIVILLILQMGQSMQAGFDQLFLMGNAGNRAVSDVLDVFVFREGIVQGNFSYTAAVGLFQSVINLILVVAANKFAKIMGESGIF